MKTIEIEVCERAMDYHLVPKRDEDGRIAVSRGGVDMVRAPKYHAQIAGKPGYWSCGTSLDDAVGNLIGGHPEIFGVTVTYLGRMGR